MNARALLFLVLPCLLLAPACGGNGHAEQTLSSISGRVVAGPVAGADVTVRPLLDTGALGDALGSGTTDSQGYFAFEVSGYDGAAVVLARGGEYVDEATGNAVVADQLEMASPVVLHAGAHHTAHVTVPTTIAARRAMQLAIDPTMDAVSALSNGIAMVEEYYGIADIVTTLPADLTAGTVPPGGAADYGALNAGFSQLAADHGMYLWSLISRLAEDASDGMFDGHYFAGPLYAEGAGGEGEFDISTGGPDLRDAVTAFASAPRNASGLTIDDLSVDDTIDDHMTPDDYSYCIYQPRIDVVEPSLGVVNEITEVTLHGQFPDLESVSLVVTFGGEVAEIVDEDWDTEEIHVLAPAIPVPGKVDVEVRCENTGVHGIAPDGFEYYVPGLDPVITSVKPDTGPQAGGTLIEVTGENFDPSAVVEVGGHEAQTLARLGRTVLLVVAPSGDGEKDITVRQERFEDDPTARQATSPGAFAYFGTGMSDEPTETELEGEWKVYGLGHAYPDTVIVMEADLVFSGGTFTESAESWFATPKDPGGSTTTLPASGPYRVFADGTLWMKDTAQNITSRAFLSDERDVMIGANDSNATAPMWLAAGIRRATGMSNASLAGTWHVAIFSHAYGTGPDIRTVSSAWGTAEFDGAGHGSAGLTASICEADPDSEAWREPMGSSLTYAVAADGTFTVTLPPPDEGGQPLVYRGSVTQRRDLAVAVSASEGEAQFLMMVPVATAFDPAYAFGSWYGGGLAYEYEPYGRGNVYIGETVRALSDGHGQGTSEVVDAITSDESANGGVETEVHDGWTWCEATGLLIGGPDELSGCIGASRRFQIFLPANLDVSPDERAVEFMGASLFLRRPAVYSSYTLDFGDYNAVGISMQYEDPKPELSMEEENTSFRTTLSFRAPAAAYEGESSDLIGRVREDAYARLEKRLYRSAAGSLSADIHVLEAASRGPYAVFGDGRMLMSLEPESDTLAASGGDMFRGVVGELIGNAHAIFLRNYANPESASAQIVLARDGTPTVHGTYHSAALRFVFVPPPPLAINGGPWERVESELGSMTLNTRASGEGYEYTESPDGTAGAGPFDWDEAPYSASGGLVAIDHPLGSLSGIATPDGEALFLVDLDEDDSTTLVVALKQAPAPVESTGTYRVAKLAHDYVTHSSTLPVEAAKEVSPSMWRIADQLDAMYLHDDRTNSKGSVDRNAWLFPDQSLAVNPDGSLAWGQGHVRGWFSANGRYAVGMAAHLEGGTVVPEAPKLYMLTR